MADSRKIRQKRDCLLLPGVNQLEDGYNFTVEVPEESRASLVL
ncbi:MAG: hypothetical protein V8Q87_13350 [Blautia wexlerae]